jgi:VCBS repeat-containing protein
MRIAKKNSALVVLAVVFAAVLSGQSSARRRAVQPPAPPAPAPAAVADTYTVERGKLLNVTAAGGVLLNDSDPQSRPLSATLVSSTTHGTLTLAADGGFTYANDSSAATTDSFTYRASNGSVSSQVATVTIVITDNPPVAAADTYNLTSATAITNTSAPGVLGNDTLNNATIVSYGASTGLENTTVGQGTATARGGSITLNANGSFAYAPPSSFTGSDTFKYVIRNGGGSSTGTVTLNAPAQTTPDFFVTSPGFFYSFSGVSGQNPVITLQRGRTYRFSIDTDDIHPFEITGAPAGSVQGNNTSFGIITFTVPSNSQNYAYHCSLHNFGNAITTTP